VSAFFLIAGMVAFVVTGFPSFSIAQNPSVSTDSQSTTTTGQGSELSRTKTMNIENRTAGMVIVPISPLIGEAWAELVYEDKTPPRATYEHFWEQGRTADIIERKDTEAAISCALMWGYLYAFMPTMGWPVKAVSKEGRNYTLVTIAHVLCVNDLASDIAAQIAASSYQTPAEAKAAIKHLLDINRKYLLQVYSRMSDFILKQTIADMSGVKDVRFALGAYHMTLGAGGRSLSIPV
jgi:hypothetical protein